MRGWLLLTALLACAVALGLPLLLTEGPFARPGEYSAPDGLQFPAGPTRLRGSGEGTARGAGIGTVDERVADARILVHGRVEDAGGLPVAGATVRLHGRVSSRVPWLAASDVATVLSGPEGVWSVNLEHGAGEVSIAAYARGVGRSTPVVVQVPDQVSQRDAVVLVLRAGEDLRVRVVGASDGDPVAGVVVGFTTGSDTRSAECGADTTGATGEVVLQDVPLPATVYVRGPGGGSSGALVRRRPTEPPYVQLAYARGAAASSLILESEAPSMSGVSVTCVLLQSAPDWCFYQRLVAVVGGQPNPVTSIEGIAEATLSMHRESGPGFELDWRDFEAQLPGEVHLSLDQVVATRLRFVTEGDGAPLPGLTYRLRCERSHLNASASVFLPTDERGEGSVWAPIGEYDVCFGESCVGHVRLGSDTSFPAVVEVRGFGTLGVSLVLPEDLGPLMLRVTSATPPSDVPPSSSIPWRAARAPAPFARSWPLGGAAWVGPVPWADGTAIQVAVVTKSSEEVLLETSTVVGASTVELDLSGVRPRDVPVHVVLRRAGAPVRSGEVWLRDLRHYPQDSGGESGEHVRAPFSYRATIDSSTGLATFHVAPGATYSVFRRSASKPVDMVFASKGGRLPGGVVRASSDVVVGHEAVEATLDLD